MMVVRLRLALSLAVILSWAVPAPFLQAQVGNYEGRNIVNIQFDPVEQPLEPSELNEILPLKRAQPLRMADIRASIGIEESTSS